MEDSGLPPEPADDNGKSRHPEKGAEKRDFTFRIPKRETVLTILALLIIFSFSYQVRIGGFHNPDGTPKWPWLRNVDSYSYFAEVNEMLEGKGSFALGSRLYQHVTVWGYRLFVGSEVNSELLTQFLVWWPAFLISLAVFPAYLLGRYLFDRKAGVLSAFFVVMAPNIASRSLAGDPDSDVMVILITMLSLALFAVAMKKFDEKKPFSRKSILYPALAAVGTALFAFTWPGYWFVFMIAIGTIILKIIITAIRSNLSKSSFDMKSFAKAWLFHLFVFVAAFWIATAPVMGVLSITNPFSQAGISSEIFGSEGGFKSEAGSFPNVYVSVAELQQGGQLGGIINRATGLEFGAGAAGMDSGWLAIVSPLVFSLFAFAYLIYAYIRRNEHLDALLILLLWIIGMAHSSVVAVRFGIFLAPAFGIAAAIGLSKLLEITFGKEEVKK